MGMLSIFSCAYCPFAYLTIEASLVAQRLKRLSACNAGDLGSIPELGRSPGEGNGNPLQYSCLENPIDGGAWWATVHGVAQSWTQLSDFTSLWRNVCSSPLSVFMLRCVCCCRVWWILCTFWISVPYLVYDSQTFSPIAWFSFSLCW